MKLKFALAALTIGLSACASTAPQNEPLGVPHNDAAGPAGRDDLTWIFNDGRSNGSGVPRLIYSARSSDELGINFQCRQRGLITVLILRSDPRGPKTWPFALVSGPEKQSLKGSVVRSEDSLLFIEATTSATAPIYQQLRRTGMLTVTDETHAREYNAIDTTERKAIADFFAACPV
jgi:hypothetical protein